MPRSATRLIWPVIVSVVCLTFTIIASRHLSSRAAAGSAKNEHTSVTQGGAQSLKSNLRRRNLALQPQASKLARALGKRFKPESTDRCLLTGSLTIDGATQVVSLIRQQRADGEQVNIYLNGSLTPLTWTGDTGAVSNTQPAAGVERVLIERLVFDSADQFVLAQLRGAGYFTVASMVRPAEAVDGYDGPAWDVVRINEPQAQASRSETPWRLYYLNLRTGLIDRVVYEQGGQQVEAQLLDWTDYQGELVPARIIWRRGGTTVMDFRLSNFSRVQQ